MSVLKSTLRRSADQVRQLGSVEVGPTSVELPMHKRMLHQDLHARRVTGYLRKRNICEIRPRTQSTLACEISEIKNCVLLTLGTLVTAEQGQRTLCHREYTDL